MDSGLPKAAASGALASWAELTAMPGASAYLQLWRQLAPYHRLGSMGLVAGNIVAAVL